jgi:hypothetical protein
LTFGAIAAAVPAVPYAARASEDVVGPILMERVCDGGMSNYPAEEKAQLLRDHPGIFHGCGAKFRWYFGSLVVCPKCGWNYMLTKEDRESHKYEVAR